MCDKPVCHCSYCLSQRRKTVLQEQNNLDAALEEAVEALKAAHEVAYEALEKEYWAICKQEEDLERETSPELN